jgi:hypothetical protein
MFIPNLARTIPCVTSAYAAGTFTLLLRLFARERTLPPAAQNHAKPILLPASCRVNVHLRFDTFFLPPTFIRDQCNIRITASQTHYSLERSIAPVEMAATAPSISSINTKENTDPNVTVDPFWDSTPRTISLPPELEIMLSARQVSALNNVCCPAIVGCRIKHQCSTNSVPASTLGNTTIHLHRMQCVSSDLG